MTFPSVEMMSVELNLNYMESMFCLHLRPPDMCAVPENERDAWLHALVKRWKKVVYSTKEAQFQVQDAISWPPPDYRPWDFSALDKMPVVLWLRTES